MVSYRRGARLVSCLRGISAAFLSVPLLLAAPGPASAQEKRQPLDFQIGYEQSEVTVSGGHGQDDQTTGSGRNGAPVIKIISPIKLGCLFNDVVVDKGKGTQRKGCFGAGIRASGAQKRLEGRWFDLDSDPAAEPKFEYRSDEFAGEVLFGQLSEVSLAGAIALRAGVNNYDLNVFDGSRRLFGERNRTAGFASWVVYFDLQTLLFPFVGFGNWPLSPVFFLLSYEETLPGYNRLRVPDINGTGNIDVELRTRTATFIVELMF